MERVIACAPEQCTCAACGQPTAVIGYDVSEQLDVEPAKYFVVVTKREKRACKHCEEGGVAAAPAPARIIEKGLVSDRVVIDTVVAKYSDHLPLYRQSAILEREAGVEISRATMDGWVMRVGELLIPIAAAMGRELVGGSYIQADETPVDVQMHDGRGQNHQAYLWQYGRPGGERGVRLPLGAGARRAEGIPGTVRRHSADRRLCRLRSRGRAEDGACRLLGARAKEVLRGGQAQPAAMRAATRIVARIDELFGIDAEAREQNLDLAARHALRLERAKPLLEIIRKEVEAARDASLPSSALGKAANYTLSLWRKLTRFLEYPELELSNNLAENSMRPVALGRKNWIHVGSQQAGPKVAAILSIVESCRRLRFRSANIWLRVLPGLAELPVQRVGELTPAAWARQRSLLS